MKFIGNYIDDKKIESKNQMAEMTLKEYYDLSKDILNNNEYQRKRVASSASIYSLLKQDLEQGCLMPPIVLAYTKEIDQINEISLTNEISSNKNNLLILDGLQRSFTIRDLVQNLPPNSPVMNFPIRVEFYIGINRLGILYRMLTLNTGQTPMSSRHQIEMLYASFMENNSINGIRLIREVENCSPKEKGEYKYKDVIDGFTSFIERNEQTIDRIDILDTVKSLRNITESGFKKSLFETFIKTYNNFIISISSLVSKTFDKNEFDNKVSLFGSDVVSIFNKSQALTGFGCAIGRLMDLKIIEKIEDIDFILKDLKCDEESIFLLLINLDKIRINAKKIGNDQRLYFARFFGILFNKEVEEYLDVKKSAEKGFEKYMREIMS